MPEEHEITTENPAAEGVSSEPERTPAPQGNDSDAERTIRQMSRRSFLWGVAATASGLAGWHWLTTRRTEDGTIWPLRRILETNEEIARDYFRPQRLSTTYPVSQAGMPKENGTEGLSEDFDPDEWRLKVYGLAPDPKAKEDADPAAAREFTLAEIKALPRIEVVTELRCIEGWSQVVQWAGTRFSDFLAKYPLASNSEQTMPPYVGLETPDSGYYVGLEIESMMHPQTLLCYEMNGQPLTLEHGAPLRLVVPVKYGIKNIKRIGTIRFATKRPADYWAEQGYDWYAGF
jgi:DMSO/TMAO reductase YedYZ molybdopterin-dependent catalytic subunit